jgi:hypothetical protein
VGLAVFIIVLVSSLTVTAALSSDNNAAPQKYPKGTICGDVQLGFWTTPQFKGKSNFQGLYSTFALDDFAVSGGNTGSVASSSGDLLVYNHQGGTLLLYATYSSMSGYYKIKGTSMYLTDFTATKVKVFFNHIKNHGQDHEVKAGTFTNIRVPNQVLPCTTQDALLT